MMITCDDAHIAMRVIISYGARRRWRRRNAYIYNTQRTHTRLTYMLSSAHPHQHACMHACSPASAPHSYATLYTHPPHTRTAPHNTHYTYIYHLLYNRTPTRTLQHTQHPTHCNTTHTQLRTACACHRDHDETGDKRQHRHTSRRPRSRRP